MQVSTLQKSLCSQLFSVAVDCWLTSILILKTEHHTCLSAVAVCNIVNYSIATVAKMLALNHNVCEWVGVGGMGPQHINQIFFFKYIFREDKMSTESLSIPDACPQKSPTLLAANICSPVNDLIICLYMQSSLMGYNKIDELLDSYFDPCSGESLDLRCTLRKISES